MAHTFELRLLDTSTVVDVYDAYDVGLDMLAPGKPWAFTLWHSREGDTPQLAAQRRTAWAVLNRAVKVGGQVLFAIDGAPQLNGRVERLEYPVSRAGGASVTLTGRDLAAGALDWDADPRVTLRGVALEEVLAELFNRVGISVTVVASAAARAVATRARPGARAASQSRQRRRQRVDLTHARPGERVWQVAESIVRRLGLMMWVAPCADGANRMALVVDAPDYAQAPTFVFERRLVPGTEVVTQASTVLESRLTLDVSRVPTIVYAMGRAPRGDHRPARHRVPYTNTGLARFPNVADPLPPQPRFLHSSRARDPATAAQEAARTMADAMATWRTYECVVAGHGQQVDGAARLYAVNTTARVYDRVGGFTLLDEEMLVTAVQFSGSRHGGQRTTVTLGTKDAIRLTPAAS